MSPYGACRLAQPPSKYPQERPAALLSYRNWPPCLGEMTETRSSDTRNNDIPAFEVPLSRSPDPAFEDALPSAGKAVSMSNAPIHEIDLKAFWKDPYPALKEMRQRAPFLRVPQLGATLMLRRDDGLPPLSGPCLMLVHCRLSGQAGRAA